MWYVCLCFNKAKFLMHNCTRTTWELPSCTSPHSDPPAASPNLQPRPLPSDPNRLLSPPGTGPYSVAPPTRWDASGHGRSFIKSWASLLQDVATVALQTSEQFGFALVAGLRGRMAANETWSLHNSHLFSLRSLLTCHLSFDTLNLVFRFAVYFSSSCLDAARLLLLFLLFFSPSSSSSLFSASSCGFIAFNCVHGLN